MQKEINWLVKNWDKIPDSFKTNIQPYGREEIPNLKKEQHFVVLLVDRQKPSVEQSYDFDEERIAVNRDGKVIWGFDSGCSCPSPWHNSYPECYSCSESWKGFEVNIEKFDQGILEECQKTIDKIKAEIK